MSFTEYLTGHSSAGSADLPGSISKLEDTSILFVQYLQRGDFDRAGAVSKQAMEPLDFVAAEFLRAKVDQLGRGTYQTSAFEAEMSIQCGSGIKNVTFADQTNILLAGPGNGHVPTGIGTPVSLSLDRLLNKIKHRHPTMMNFRIEAGRHIFVICTDHTKGGAEGIYEFDVGHFCRLCSSAARKL